MKNMLKRIIADFHASSLPVVRSREIEIPLGTGKIISIIGPRRAGKTCSMFGVMKRILDGGVDRRRILYVNFEDERLEGVLGDQILDAYLELYPDLDVKECFFFFDEIQEMANWEKFVRRFYDSVSRKVFLTGSNARLLSSEIATALRGRGLCVEIFPLSLGEYLGFRGVDSNDRYSTQNTAAIRGAFEEYLCWGGYPEIVDLDVRHKASVLQEYFNVMVYRDLIQRYGIKDHTTLKYLLKRLLSSFTSEYSLNKIYNERKSAGLSLGKNALYAMADAVFSVFIVTGVERYDPSVVKREMSKKKVYAFDGGMVSAVHFATSADKGKYLENFVFSHLRRITSEIFFLKTGQAECDFIAKTRDGMQCIQVCQDVTVTNVQRELKGLKAGMQAVGAEKGVLVCESVQNGVDLPSWCRVNEAWRWGLDVSDLLEKNHSQSTPG